MQETQVVRNQGAALISPTIAAGMNSVSSNFLDEVLEVFQIFKNDLDDTQVSHVMESMELFKNGSFKTLTPLLQKVFKTLVASENQNMIREFFKNTLDSEQEVGELAMELDMWLVELARTE